MKSPLSVFTIFTIIILLLFYSICFLSCSFIDSISKEQEEHEGNYCKGQLVTSFFHKYYPYTTYNQSIAVWDEMAFCFNDTNYADTYGFCVVIDVMSGNVIERISEVPHVVSPKGGGPSHLNNACFTDQYYKTTDKYPLLLLSRGDYPNPSNKKGEELYVFRIIEENGSFSFEHIKTIITKHDYLTTHNPTWEYDSSRKMIWGHCLSEDWRWCEYVSFPFRSFSMPGGMYFKAFGASYVCVKSRDKASSDTKVTITIGEETRIINVKKGDSISEVFRYVENEGGCCFIICNQENKSFRQKFDVYTCDSNGNTMTLLVMRVAIVGFEAPDLSDSTTIVINNSDFSQPVYIDEGIVQGGACYDGKLFIPFHNYMTINGQPSDNLSPICLIVDPTTGKVDSFIRLSSEREPEGCAIYEGNLYISHHIGNATYDTASPSFELYKYPIK